MNNANETAAVKLEPFIPMDKKDIIRAAIYGTFAGAILTVLYILVGRVASAVMCRGDNDLCQNAPLYVAIFSVTLVSIGGLILLSQARIYRPLFIVLWGLQSYLALLPWYWAMAAMTVIGALTYAMFTWLARLRSFILYLVVSIVLIVAARLIIAG